MKISLKLLFIGILSAVSFTLLAQNAPPRMTNQLRPGMVPDRMGPRPARAQTGKLVSIDKTGKMFTVGPMENNPSSVTSNTIVQLGTNSVLIKSGKRITLDEMATGDSVRFQLRPTPEGKMVASFVVVGPLPPARGPGSSGTVPPGAPGATPATPQKK